MQIGIPSYITKGIGFIIIGEIVLCGSGQVFHVFGSITLRMLLFILALLITIIFIRKFRIPYDLSLIFLGYILILSLSTSFSLINNNTSTLIEDIKPQLYILIFPLMYILISSKKNIEIISKIISQGALMMAIIYLIYLCLIKYLGLINFNIFYASMEEESDFMFRGERGELFYKGFVFLPIATIFYLHNKKYLNTIILLVAIFFTLTRGFYIITLSGILLYYLFFPSFSGKKIIICCFTILVILVILSTVDWSSIIGNRDDSDLTRIITFKQVIERATPFSIVWGHGLGCGVPIRPVHMESSFLEIFHKQGIIGLLFWLFILIKELKLYFSLNIHGRRISIPYFIGVIMIYIQSLFNPYLSNPIGITMIIIGYLVMYYISNNHENISNHCSV